MVHYEKMHQTFMINAVVANKGKGTFFSYDIRRLMSQFLSQYSSLSFVVSVIAPPDSEALEKGLFMIQNRYPKKI